MKNYFEHYIYLTFFFVYLHFFVKFVPPVPKLLCHRVFLCSLDVVLLLFLARWVCWMVPNDAGKAHVDIYIEVKDVTASHEKKKIVKRMNANYLILLGILWILFKLFFFFCKNCRLLKLNDASSVSSLVLAGFQGAAGLLQ